MADRPRGPRPRGQHFRLNARASIPKIKANQPRVGLPCRRGPRVSSRVFGLRLRVRPSASGHLWEVFQPSSSEASDLLPRRRYASNETLRGPVLGRVAKIEKIEFLSSTSRIVKNAAMSVSVARPRVRRYEGCRVPSALARPASSQPINNWTTCLM
jgi:hypothetical protein